MSLYVSSTQMVLDNWVVAVVCLFEYFFGVKVQTQPFGH